MTGTKWCKNIIQTVRSHAGTKISQKLPKVAQKGDKTVSTLKVIFSK